ncbi:MAG: ATP-grasp domain-containing protein [Flavobacteria bacterium RIFCSPLOWO2_12_FULL_35_11]|nr:MAG: ATP-grasp domain-containing protein [Flavobacteria bacterium RIFCSPLOWO2_12_FULL_35_11]
MILIDQPYISSFLLKTIKENHLEIVATEAARAMISDDSLNWISEKKAVEFINNNPTCPLYTNSENTISWIEKNLASTKLPGQIQVFKNKIKFRELLKAIFPNYFFKGIKFEELAHLSLSTIKFPFIIKPAVGFFSLGVHKVDNFEEWPAVLNKITNDIAEIRSFYPNEVVDTSNFIVEECIEGEEYAMDCYFNTEGKPVILSILHHRFSTGKDVNDRVYTTSEEIIEKHLPTMQEFLNTLGALTNLNNFPFHVEVRIDKNGTIIPIEVNPMRFGGWCTTADLSYFAFGFNSYQYFLNGTKPNWNELFKSGKNKKYSLILLDNNSGIPENKIASFDYDLLLSDFENPLELRKVDFNDYPFFGMVFVETSLGNEKELDQILTSDLKKYIKVKNN